MLKRVCLALGIVACLGSLALAVVPNTPGSITAGNIQVFRLLGEDKSAALPIQVNDPTLATGPATEIIAWVLEVGNTPLMVNGPILVDTAPLGSFNVQDFDSPGVDLLTGTIFGPAAGGNHGSSPARSIVPPAPPSTAGVNLIQVGVATSSGNPAAAGFWNGLLARLLFFIDDTVPDGLYHIQLEDHPTQGSTSLGGFFDENFEFIVNQPDVINGTIEVITIVPEPGTIVMAAMAALGLGAVIIRKRRRA